jgi:hypothetical protein
MTGKTLDCATRETVERRRFRKSGKADMQVTTFVEISHRRRRGENPRSITVKEEVKKQEARRNPLLNERERESTN